MLPKQSKATPIQTTFARSSELEPNPKEGKQIELQKENDKYMTSQKLEMPQVIYSTTQ